MNSFSAKHHVCSRCGSSFSRRYNLERHVRSMHPEEEDEDDEEEEKEEEDSNEETESDEEESDLDMEDNEAYQEWYEDAMAATEEMRRDKYQKYVNGMDPDMAKEKAYLKTVWAVKREFFERYKTFLRDYARLKDDEAYEHIVQALDEKIVLDGVDPDKAVKRIMAKHESKFDGLFQYYDDDDDEEEEDMESDEADD